MLPLRHRLPLRTQSSFFREAHKKRKSSFQMYWKEKVGISQAAIIIPSQVVPLSTKRNALKRAIRVALLPLLKSQQNKEIVLVLYSQDKRKIIRELTEEFQVFQS